MCSPRVEGEDFGWSEILEDNGTPGMVPEFSQFWCEVEGS
jgi:hypothetical protein